MKIHICSYFFAISYYDLHVINVQQKQAKARAIIDKQGFMTLSDYADATGQSKTGASRDLKRLVADASTGIVAHGDYSHKIWVKSKINRQ